MSQPDKPCPVPIWTLKSWFSQKNSKISNVWNPPPPLTHSVLQMLQMLSDEYSSKCQIIGINCNGSNNLTEQPRLSQAGHNCLTGGRPVVTKYTD